VLLKEAAARKPGCDRLARGAVADLTESVPRSGWRAVASGSIVTGSSAPKSCLLPSSRGSSHGSNPGFAMHAPLADLFRRMSLREQEGSVAILERYLNDRRKPLKGVALLAERHGLPTGMPLNRSAKKSMKSELSHQETVSAARSHAVSTVAPCKRLERGQCALAKYCAGELQKLLRSFARVIAWLTAGKR
jgi:hypothetical protein